MRHNFTALTTASSAEPEENVEEITAQEKGKHRGGGKEGNAQPRFNALHGTGGSFFLPTLCNVNCSIKS